jgi:hypothetical protein
MDRLVSSKSGAAASTAPAPLCPAASLIRYCATEEASTAVTHATLLTPKTSRALFRSITFRERTAAAAL